MSIEAYKVAVKLQLVENVSRGLAALAPHFLKADQNAKQLEKTLVRIEKMTLAGGAMSAAGAFGLKALEAPLNTALEYERHVAKMRQMGLGDQQIIEAKKFVEANDVINTSMLDRMRIFSEAQGSFRESGLGGDAALHAAKTMTPVLATYEAAMSTLDGSKHEAAEGAMRNLNKTVEIMGGLGNVDLAQKIADGVFKAVQSSGKMVSEQQLKQFVAYGGSASNSIDPRIIFGGLEPLIGEYGGSRVGTALRTAFNRMSGAMSMPPKLMQESLTKLGIGQVDASKTRLNDSMLKTMQTNPIEFAQKMMATYEKHGIKTVLDRERMNSILFSPSSANIYNKIMSQMETIGHSLKSFDMAKGASDVVNDPQNKAIMAIKNYQKKIEDLHLAIGQSGVIELATKAFYALGGAIKMVTDFARAHPLITKLAVVGFMAISAITLLGGSLLLLKASLIGLALLNPAMLFGSIASGFGLLLTPIGLTVLAIASVALLLYNNWSEISKSLTTMWTLLKAGFTKLFHGDILGAWYSFSGLWLKGFQTLLNTIIAGVNLIPGVNIQKFDFADKYNAEHNRQSPNVPNGNKSIVINPAPVYLDGKQVTSVVFNHAGKEASRPNVFGYAFDSTLTTPLIGQRL